MEGGGPATRKFHASSVNSDACRCVLIPAYSCRCVYVNSDACRCVLIPAYSCRCVYGIGPDGAACGFRTATVGSVATIYSGVFLRRTGRAPERQR